MSEAALLRFGPDGVELVLPAFMQDPENGERGVPDHVLAATEAFTRATEVGIRDLADAFEARVKRNRMAN